jgi:hypothetical protein
MLAVTFVLALFLSHVLLVQLLLLLLLLTLVFLGEC